MSDLRSDTLNKLRRLVKQHQTPENAPTVQDEAQSQEMGSSLVIGDLIEGVSRTIGVVDDHGVKIADQHLRIAQVQAGLGYVESMRVDIQTNSTDLARLASVLEQSRMEISTLKDERKMINRMMAVGGISIALLSVAVMILMGLLLAHIAGEMAAITGL